MDARRAETAGLGARQPGVAAGGGRPPTEQHPKKPALIGPVDRRLVPPLGVYCLLPL
jgi:hypothetical protein